jgi:hypothetical protein
MTAKGLSRHCSPRRGPAALTAATTHINFNQRNQKGGAGECHEDFGYTQIFYGNLYFADCGDAAHFHPVQTTALLRAAKPTSLLRRLSYDEG